MRIRLLPGPPNQCQLSLDGCQRPLQFCGNLDICVAFQFQLDDFAELIVRKLGEEPLLLLGDLGGKGRRGLIADNVENRYSIRRIAGTWRRERNNRGTAARVFPPECVNCFAMSKHHQDLPQIMTIIESWELSFLRGQAETLKRAQRDVLGLLQGARLPFQLRPGQIDQPVKVALPAFLRSDFVAPAKAVKPARYRTVVFHGRFPDLIAVTTLRSASIQDKLTRIFEIL